MYMQVSDTTAYCTAPSTTLEDQLTDTVQKALSRYRVDRF